MCSCVYAQAAAGAGIDVCACSLSSAEIGEYLQSGRYVAIMLVDKCLLDQSLWNKQTSCTSCWSAQHLASLSYTGTAPCSHLLEGYGIASACCCALIPCPMKCSCGGGWPDSMPA